MNLDKITISGGYSGTSADILDKMVVKSIEDDLQNIDELNDIKTTIKNVLLNKFAFASYLWLYKVCQ